MNEKVTKVPELGFGEALKQALNNIVRFDGRARRSEFWWCVLAVIIANIVLRFIPVVGGLCNILLSLAMIPLTFRRLHDTGRSGWWCGIGVIGTVVGYGVIFYTMFSAIGYDTLMELSQGGMESQMAVAKAMEASPGSLLPVSISSLVGIAYNIMMIVYMCLDSEPTANKYGPSPKYIVEETPESL